MTTTQAPVLLIYQTPDAPKRWSRFEEATIKLGRLPTVHLSLEDKGVNRIHAVIENRGPNKCQLIDMGSSKGSFVNGQRVQRGMLQSGDQIRLGDTTLTFVQGKEAIQEALFALQEPTAAPCVSIRDESPLALFAQAESTQVTQLPVAPQVEVQTPQSQVGASYVPPAQVEVPHQPTPRPQPVVESFWQAAQDTPVPQEAQQPQAPQLAWQVAAQPSTPYQGGYTAQQAPQTQAPVYQPQPVVAAKPKPLWEQTPQRPTQAQAPIIQAQAPQVSHLPQAPQVAAYPEGHAALAPGQAVEVQMLWGDRVLAHSHFVGPKEITIGASRKCTFTVSSEALADDIMLPLVVMEDEHYYVQYTDQMDGYVSYGGHHFDFASLRQSRRSKGTERGQRLPLPAKGTTVIQLDQIFFFIKIIQQPETAGFFNTFQADPTYGRALGASLLFHALLVLFMLFSDEVPQSLDDQFLKGNDRFAALIVRPEEPEKPKPQKLAAGKKAAGKKAKMGKQNETQKNRKSSQIKRNPDGNAPIDMKKVTDKVIKDIQKKALLGILNGGRASKGGSLLLKGIGGGDIDAYGNWVGTRGGRASGGGGLGLDGKGGIGGGGLGGDGAGIGDIGRYNPKGVPGGRGWKLSKMTKKNRHKVVVTTDQSQIVSDGLDRKIIQRYIRMYRNRIRYCYERELRKNPFLTGKVEVSFRIEANGKVYKSSIKRSTLNNDRVEQCLARRIRIIQFPAPKGGGIVLVNYPFLFQAASK